MGDVPDEQAEHQMLHPPSQFRQASHAPDGTEVSLAEDGQDRSASLWLHGSPSHRCWRSPPGSTAPPYGIPHSLDVKYFFSATAQEARGKGCALRRRSRAREGAMRRALADVFRPGVW